MQTPIAFFLYKRPHLSEKIFEAIASVKPGKLLVVADGPKNESERELCVKARSVLDRVDWECHVETNFSDSNLGCRNRLSTGLDWVFERCEAAIILEDDTLPHISFFRYCSELLERYREDERIMAISGNNFLFGHLEIPHSYYFSRFTHNWGWASWRRAWKHYDVEMKRWPSLRDTNFIRDLFGFPQAQDFWRRMFEMTFNGEIDTWDFQWTFACWVQGGLSILPNRNLVTNIGFAGTATHTFDTSSPFSNLPCNEMSFPLDHPAAVIANHDADRFTFYNSFEPELKKPSFWERAKRKWYTAT